MRPYDIIRKKRDGQRLTKREIKWFVNAHLQGKAEDYHVSAFAMAVFFTGMIPAETGALTDAFLHSGDVVDPDSICGFGVDKHSTGGVGDTVSLILAPLAASLGVAVPMVSGRGLGHTGGTLDKLEAIPGFRTDLDLDIFVKTCNRIGLCMIGQTERMCPADKRWYAIRDVSATVESIPLIVASIMSKKLAEGVNGLVLDVKVGSGAFMKTMPDAETLARALVATGQSMGRKVRALITDMNQPLAQSIGNALETAEAIRILRNEQGGPLRDLSVELTAHMTVMAGKFKSLATARKACEKNLENQKALEKFRRMIQAQHGDPSVCDDPTRLPAARIQKVFPSAKTGIIQSMDATSIGLASIALGAGRARTDDIIDPAVGLVMAVRLGDRVRRGQKILTLHANDAGRLKEAEAILRRSFIIGNEPVDPPALLKKVIE